MLFSKNDNSAEQKNTKKQSLWGFLFNPNFGDDIRPLGQNLRMFARFMMYILASQKLFPKEHPAYADESISLSLMDVFRIAFARLQFTKEGLPQVLLFFAVVGCYVFSVLFVIFFLLSLLIGSAHAADGDVKSMFVVQNASCDLAQRWISYLFLGEDVNSYESCGVGAMAPNGQLIQTAIGAGLSMYSHAILVCAGFILLYHLATMIAETAHSGKPMGRANQIWAPIRLVVAIGLLIPIGSGTQGMSTGLNTAQFVVIQMAKWGSGLASNTWSGFLKTLNEEVGKQELIVPPPPYTEGLIKQIIMLQACKDMYNDTLRQVFTQASIGQERIDKFTIQQPVFGPSRQPSYEYDYDTMGYTISGGVDGPDFAVYSNKLNPNDESGDYVNCGSVSMPDPPKKMADPTSNAVAQAIYNGTTAYIKDYISSEKTSDVAQAASFFLDKSISQGSQTVAMDIEVANKVRKHVAEFSSGIQRKVVSSLKGGTEHNTWTVKIPDIQKLNVQGWVMAGAWFNTIARAQGLVHDQVETSVAVKVNAPSLQTNRETSAWKSIKNFFGYGIEKEDIKIKDMDKSVNEALGKLKVIVEQSSEKTITELAATGTDSAANPSVATLVTGALVGVEWLGEKAGLWGKEGLAITFGKKANPMAEVVSFGHRLISVGTTTMVIAGGASVVTEFMGAAVSPVVSGLSKAAGAIFGLVITIAASLIVFGLTLAFYIPLLPFIKFFFNVMTWILMVFEAVVSAPLWALAHLTPYGDGLPGGMAQKGYFFLLAILLRPVLLVFGLCAGLLLFFIAIYFLNNSFSIATAGVGALEGGSTIIAKAIYSFIYVGFVYICTNTCFKSISFFADHGMNWMSASGPQAVPMGDTGTMGKAAGIAGLYAGNKLAEQISAGTRTVGEARAKTLAQAKAKRDGESGEDFQARMQGYVRDSSDPTGWRYVGHGNNGSQLPPTGTSPAIPPGGGGGGGGRGSGGASANASNFVTIHDVPTTNYEGLNNVTQSPGVGVDVNGNSQLYDPNDPRWTQTDKPDSGGPKGKSNLDGQSS